MVQFMANREALLSGDEDLECCILLARESELQSLRRKDNRFINMEKAIANCGL